MSLFDSIILNPIRHKKNCKNFILFFFLAFLSSNLSSQNKILRFEHLTVSDGLSQNTINGIAKDKYGFMWFGTWEGLCRYDGYKFTVYWADINDPHKLYNNRIRYIYKDKDDIIWISNFGNLFCRYNYDSDDFTRVPKSSIPKQLVDSLDRDICKFHTYAISKEYTWEINPNNDLEVLAQTNRKNGKKIDYRTDPFNPWAVNDEFVFNIYFDNNEILWIGTYSGGINWADSRQKPFYHYYHKYHDDNSIIDNLIRPIYVDNQDNIWVGTLNKGVTKIDRHDNKYTHLQHNPKDSANSLINNQIRKIYCDQYGYVWFGTKRGLDRYDPRTKRFVHYASKTNHPIPHNWVYAIMEDHCGYLWIGTFNGIAKYDRKKERFLAYNPKTTLKSGRVRVILEDKRNNLWVATEGGGITRLSRDSARGFEEKLYPKHYFYDPHKPNSLGNDRVFSMIEDENGIFWIGTAGGVSRFDPVSNKFNRFSAKDGLPDELIVGLVSDQKGSLWLSHKKGLTRMDTKNFTIRNFNQGDGLQSNEFSEDAYFRNTRTGEIFFGGVNGFNSFFPDSIKDNPFMPNVVLTSLLISNRMVPINKPVNGRVILHKSITLTDEIRLTYKEKAVSIEFAALHYSNPQGNKYSYILEGFDMDWINTDASNRFVTYSNLEPKTYIFKVKACNSDGVWNPKPRVLIIIVLPPWWKTWWFRTTSLLFILVLFLSFLQIRLSHYRNKQRELTILVKNRTLELEGSNELLRERQTRIEEQTEELRSANELLLEKQKLIQIQAEELQGTNQQLMILNSTKDKFFSIIAHDLKNPFHVVNGFSELLIKDFKKLPTDKIERYLELIHKTSAYGNNLLDNLLQWSRSQSGRISFEPIKIALSTMVEEIIYLFEGEAHTKNIKIESFINSTLTVTADENMLNTIFRNLLSNAIKFTHKGGNISIKAIASQSFVEISIIDSGVGISEESCRLLFNIHTNISTKGTLNESGTGLGLVLCREFVEKHGGTIWVESEIDKGSTFQFTLPNA